MRKVAVIGLDGADWRLLKPWIHDGHLPTLAKLVAGGTHGKLRSTVRPESSVAWSSFSTGVNPGKHGVFGFAERAGEGYSFRLANSSSVRARRFWDLLGRQGFKVGLLNIPFTYPPSPVNGSMVTGMLTPGADVTFTYPRELQQQLLDRFEDYVFDAGDLTKDRAALIASVHAYTRQQRETALLLLREKPWDFFAVVFTGPDRLQHFLWADMDPRHPFHDPEVACHFGHALLEHYRALDAAIAGILDCLPSDALVLLMSDHGFNGCARRFYVNRWLKDQGLLTVSERRGYRAGLASLLTRVGSVEWIRRLKRAIFPAEWSSVDLRSRVFAQAIDWSRTKAYFGLDGGLRVNLCGRDPGGIVPVDQYDTFRQELRQAVLAVSDPETKRPPVADVFLREELYHGPFVDRAPDLILEPQRNNPDFTCNFVLDSSLEGRASAFGSSVPYSGNHTLDGVFVAWGADVAGGRQIQGARIVDVAPTVLAALGVAIPEHVDGRVLAELFLPGRAPTPRRAVGAGADVPEELGRSFSPDEEIAVENRLRDLGYLD